jgi:hypothetical protein
VYTPMVAHAPAPSTPGFGMSVLDRALVDRWRAQGFREVGSPDDDWRAMADGMECLACGLVGLVARRFYRASDYAARMALCCRECGHQEPERPEDGR